MIIKKGDLGFVALRFKSGSGEPESILDPERVHKDWSGTSVRVILWSLNPCGRPEVSYSGQLPTCDLFYFLIFTEVLNFHRDFFPSARTVSRRIAFCARYLAGSFSLFKDSRRQSSQSNPSSTYWFE